MQLQAVKAWGPWIGWHQPGTAGRSGCEGWCCGALCPLHGADIGPTQPTLFWLHAAHSLSDSRHTCVSGSPGQHSAHPWHHQLLQAASKKCLHQCAVEQCFMATGLAAVYMRWHIPLNTFQSSGDRISAFFFFSIVLLPVCKLRWSQWNLDTKPVYSGNIRVTFCVLVDAFWNASFWNTNYGRYCL